MALTERLVPAVRTPIAPQALYDALSRAWQPLIGSEPTRASMLVLMAQSAFESGWWHWCWNWNLGNAKHVSGDGRDYYMVRCNEVIGGKVFWLDPPNPGCAFRAFDSLATGIVDYLTLMHGQFGYAWPAVEAGDAADFCHRLRARGYYTDDEAHYTANVVGCMHSLDLIIPTAAQIAASVVELHPEFVLPEDDAQSGTGDPGPDGSDPQA